MEIEQYEQALKAALEELEAWKSESLNEGLNNAIEEVCEIARDYIHEAQAITPVAGWIPIAEAPRGKSIIVLVSGVAYDMKMDTSGKWLNPPHAGFSPKYWMEKPVPPQKDDMCQTCKMPGGLHAIDCAEVTRMLYGNMQGDETSKTAT